MADISKIKMPSGNVYDIKDAVAREAIAGGVSFIVAWNGTSTPVVADIPAGVTVTYNGTTYTGTLAAADAQPGAFYLVNTLSEPNNIYSEYVPVGSAIKTWEKLGDTTVDISDLGALAYKDNVTLSKGSGDQVLGEATTFTAASSSVSFSGGTTDKVLGSDATFSTSVATTKHRLSLDIGGVAVGGNGTASAVTGYASPATDGVLGEATTFSTTVNPTTTNIKATASGTAVGADGTDTFVKSYPGTTSKMVTTTITGTNGTESVSAVSHTSKKLATTSIPNVTSVGSASSWSFAMGSGNDAETLIISGSNSTTPTLGTAITAATGALVATSTTTNVGGTIVDTVTETAKTVAKAASSATTVATGALNASATGDAVMTGLGTATTASALTGVKVTTQPTVALSTGATAGTGVISVATGISSASTTAGTNDKVTAITGLGSPSTATVLTGVTVVTQPSGYITDENGDEYPDGYEVVCNVPSATTTVNNKDEVTAVTGVGTGTAAAQTITVGTNDKVKVAVYGDLSVSVS